MLDILFVALLQTAAGEPAPTAPSSEPAAQSEASEETAAPDEAVRCRRVRELGSRTRSRLVCTTQSQDEQQQEDNRRLQDRMRRSVPTEPTPMMGGGR